MAAFTGFNLVVPTLTFNRASVFAASRCIQRRSSLFAMTAARVAAAAGEAALFLWMVFAVASLLLVVAAFLM